MSDPQEPLEDLQETVNDDPQTADRAELSVEEEDGASSCRSASRSPELGELYYGGEEEEEVPVELGRAIAAHLERLSTSGSNLNELEVRIVRLRREYDRVKDESLKMIKTLKTKLQAHITKTEPFIAIWHKARKVQNEAHRAATRYERAQSEFESAKETLRIAERGLSELKEQQMAEEVDKRSSNACKLDQAWQETLANATLRVMKAETERVTSEREHRSLTSQYLLVQEEHRTLEKRLKKSIEKSKPYFETRFRCNAKLQGIKQKIGELEEQVKKNKMEYKFTMSSLESVSEGIHARRRCSSLLSPAVSEPSIVDRMSSLVINLPRKAVTPDLRRKETTSPNGLVHSFKPLFKGSSGSLPSVQASKITAHAVGASTVTGQAVGASTVTGQAVGASTDNGEVVGASTVTGQAVGASTVTGQAVVASTDNGEVVGASTVTGQAVVASTVTGQAVVASTVTGQAVVASTVTGQAVVASTDNGRTVNLTTVIGESSDVQTDQKLARHAVTTSLSRALTRYQQELEDNALST